MKPSRTQASAHKNGFIQLSHPDGRGGTTGASPVVALSPRIISHWVRKLKKKTMSFGNSRYWEKKGNYIHESKKFLQYEGINTFHVCWGEFFLMVWMVMRAGSQNQPRCHS